MNIFDPIGPEARARAAMRMEQEIARDNDLYEIKQNTADMNQRIEDANERILLLNKQLDAANDELRKTREECDTVNKQLLEYQIDSQKRDEENKITASEARTFSIISLLLAAIAAAAALAALLKV